jgi:thiamine biosynthesis lipoprotein
VSALPAAPPPVRPAAEHRDTFACFGSECAVIVAGGAGPDDGPAALALARRRLLGWHQQFSRFEPASELSLLNADARPTVPVSPLMRRILDAAARAAGDTDGLVDPTLGAQIERAGYGQHFEGPGLELSRLMALAPPRAPAHPNPARAWRRLTVDRRGGTVTRPPGLRIDPGGIAKGVFADELGALLAGFDAYVVDCAGDIRIGGRAGTPREVGVASPFGEGTVHALQIAAGAVATSGIGRRSWLTGAGDPAHHLLDPSTGAPAFTGVVQATALAPTATEAEMRSQAAVLSGPAGARRWLIHGGVVVLDDGRVHVVAARR